MKNARMREFAAWVSTRPNTAIVGMAMFSVVLSCYPVVFFGRSFVSPNNNGYVATHLLYEALPTLPGYQSTTVENEQGADIGAIMWGHLPYSVIQSRAIFDDAELPLWNRYNFTGVTLLGQGFSMFGDPLHMIVVLAKGASWAWDVKYVLAKILFAMGVGLTVYAATHHLPSALILSFSSSFIGFFSFRFNHPAFFSLCYAPWILYFWFRFIHATTSRGSALAIGGLILASWMEMTSGTAKEAYMLLIFLNLGGLVVFLWSEETVPTKLKKGLQLVGAGVLFTMISSPVWLTFLDALAQSYTGYNVPLVRKQIPLSLFIALFDDMFFHPFTSNQLFTNPSTNFLILFGVLWSVARVRECLRDRAYVAVLMSSLLPFSLAFAVMPVNVILAIPILRNVYHVANTFSCVFIIHLILLAGFGVKACWESFGEQRWTRDLLVTTIMLALLLGVYWQFPPEDNKSPFFYGYAISLVAGFLALPLIGRYVVHHGTTVPVAAVLIVAVLVVLHWRHGMHVKTGFDDYVMNPQVRVNLQVESPAVNVIKSEAEPPFRTVGFNGNLFPGFNGVLAVESISGVDALINPHYRELTDAAGVPLRWGSHQVVQKETLGQLRSFYDFLNIKYYLGLETDRPREDPKFDFVVYMSRSVWPRAFFTDTLSMYDTPREFVQMIKGGDGRPFAAIMRGDLNREVGPQMFLGNQATRRVVSASGYQLTNNTTSFTIDAPGSGVVAVTEAYLDRDFQVSVNGKSVPYFRVNHAFKGLVVEKAGSYKIMISYWPKHLTLSLWLAIVGLLLLLMWLGHSWRQDTRSEPLVVDQKGLTVGYLV